MFQFCRYSKAENQGGQRCILFFSQIMQFIKIFRARNVDRCERVPNVTRILCFFFTITNCKRTNKRYHLCMKLNTLIFHICSTSERERKKKHKTTKIEHVLMLFLSISNWCNKVINKYLEKTFFSPSRTSLRLVGEKCDIFVAEHSVK